MKLKRRPHHDRGKENQLRKNLNNCLYYLEMWANSSIGTMFDHGCFTEGYSSAINIRNINKMIAQPLVLILLGIWVLRGLYIENY